MYIVLLSLMMLNMLYTHIIANRKFIILPTLLHLKSNDQTEYLSISTYIPQEEKYIILND